MRPETVEHLRGNWRARHPLIWREAVRRRTKRPVAQWAREVRKMRGGPIAGNNTIPFSTEFVPHTVAQMEACDDPRVNLIVIWGPIRDAKTTAALCAIGRTVTDDPGGIFSVWPTKEDADKFSEDDLETMIETSLGGYFVEKKSRDSGRTKTFKKFRGGSIRIPSAGAITAFRGSTVKVLHLPEADALNPESIYKAFGRTTGIADAIKIMESTGTLASEVGEDGKTVWHSIIAEHYDQSDQQKWFVECAECHELSVIYYPQIRADSGDAQEARWHCARCDRGHVDAEWFRATQAGLWLPTAGLSADDLLHICESHLDAKAKRPEFRGFWRNGFNSLLPVEKGFTTKLHQFLAEGEAAKSSPEKLKTWTNEIAAELWNPTPAATEPPPWRAMFDRREDYGLTVPASASFLTAFTDVHQNRLEVEWKAWGRNEESWGMAHRVILGSVYQPDVWQNLRREMARKFRHAIGDGVEIGLGFGLVDGGDYAEWVYRFFQDLVKNPEPGVSGNLYASKGFGAHPHPIIDPQYRTVAKNLKGFHIGTWQAKKLLYQERFRMIPGYPHGKDQEADPSDSRTGLMHWNLEYSQEYFEQSTREKPRIEIVRGDEVWKFELKSHLRNEGLDLNVGNLAALKRWPRPWDLLEADLRERAKSVKRPVSDPIFEHRNSSVAVPGW